MPATPGGGGLVTWARRLPVAEAARQQLTLEVWALSTPSRGARTALPPSQNLRCSFVASRL